MFAKCSCHPEMSTPAAAGSRREFMTRVALGAGAAMFMSFVPQVARAAGGTDALLLSCMDYRLVDDIVKYMDGRGMNGKYDHVVLAGASLGATTDKQKAWGETFWAHLGVAIDLHHIKNVIVMDHRDCGAYKVFLGEEVVKEPKIELATHTKHLNLIRSQIKAKHTTLEVELLIMALDGKVETVA